MLDLYRDAQPDPMDITKLQWQTILAFIGATEEEIKDVQMRMGRGGVNSYTASTTGALAG